VKPTLEGGMPHTRGQHIILPAPLLGAFQQMAGAGDAGAAAAAGLLVHEQTHVVERLHPDWFKELFTHVFGFRHAKQILPDPWVTTRQLVNPDGIDTNWVFPLKDDNHPNGEPRWIWPLVIFADPDAKSLHQMSMVALELEQARPGAAVAPDTFKLKLDASGEPVHQSLPDVDAYVHAVRTRQNLYHPNEAAADMMARLVIADGFGKAAAQDDQQMAPVRDWARATFGSKDGPKPSAQSAPSRRPLQTLQSF
jgi:hypothetical protein